MNILYTIGKFPGCKKSDGFIKALKGLPGLIKSKKLFVLCWTEDLLYSGVFLYIKKLIK